LEVAEREARKKEELMKRGERDAADAARRRGRIVAPGAPRSDSPHSNPTATPRVSQIAFVGSASRAELTSSETEKTDEGEKTKEDDDQKDAKPKFTRPSVVRRGNGPEKRTPRRVGL
jgi:hypothetical protein